MLFRTIIRQSLTLVWPTVTSRVLYTLALFINMALLGRLSHEALAAGALISSSNITVNISIASMLFSISPIIAKTHGKGAHHKVGNIFHMGILIALLMSLFSA